MTMPSENTPAPHAREWPVKLIWALLAGASVLGFLFAEGMAPARIATIAAFVLAAIKVDLVIVHYMELEWRHKPLRVMLAVWLFVVTAVLLGTYLMT